VKGQGYTLVYITAPTSHSIRESKPTRRRTRVSQGVRAPSLSTKRKKPWNHKKATVRCRRTWVGVPSSIAVMAADSPSFLWTIAPLLYPRCQRFISLLVTYMPRHSSPWHVASAILPPSTTNNDVLASPCASLLLPYPDLDFSIPRCGTR
jgi:hypothetical protein